MAWASVAKWRKCDINLMNGDNSSIDKSHLSKDEALAAIRLLEKNGLGGRGEVFPIETFIFEVENNTS